MVIDQSGRNNDAVVFGATRVEDPERGWVCEFDGLDDYLNCGDKDDFEFSSQGFTVAMWFKTAGSMSHTRGVLQKGYQNPYADSNYALFFREPDGVGFSFRGSSTGESKYAPDSYAFLNHEWHHVVVTFDNGDGMFRIYIDGIFRH